MQVDFWIDCRRSGFPSVMWLSRLRSSKTTTSPFLRSLDHSASDLLSYPCLELTWFANKLKRDKKIPLIFNSWASLHVWLCSWWDRGELLDSDTRHVSEAGPVCKLFCLTGYPWCSSSPSALHCWCYCNWVRLTGSWEQSTHSTLSATFFYLPFSL